MIDTYFDRVDAAQGFKPKRSRPVHDDPRYFNGHLYATMLDRNVAEAKANLEHFIDMTWEHHRYELAMGIPYRPRQKGNA
jgi:hypothetical protein